MKSWKRYAKYRAVNKDYIRRAEIGAPFNIAVNYGNNNKNVYGGVLVFSSIAFIYFFAVFAIAAYYIVPKRYGNAALAFVSIVFYAVSGIYGLFTAVVCGAVTYCGGLLTDKYRGKKISEVISAVTVIFLIGTLCIFKYQQSTISVLGISFFTFRAVSYVIDIKRGAAAENSIAGFAAWFFMFPIMPAGPIVKYGEISAEIKSRTASVSDISDGIARFSVGLIKKSLIADGLLYVCTVYKSQPSPSVLFAWFYAVCYTLYIYYDFSGYSDMAIGLGRIFGFRLPENFDYPYISASISEFWRRWHITLGAFFRDYVYIPLGGNRHGKARTAINLAAVWILTGLWHGASWNFVLWGAWYGVLIICEKLFYKKIRSRLYTMLSVMLGFVIFDGGTVSGAFLTLGRMFGIGAALYDKAAVYYIGSNAVLIIISAIGATPLIKNTLKKIKRISGLRPAAVCASLALATACAVDGSYNPFLYFRF